MVYGISVFECIWCIDGIEVILKPVCKHFITLTGNATSCRNVIDHTSSPVFVASWLVFPFKERKFIRFCIYM